MTDSTPRHHDAPAHREPVLADALLAGLHQGLSMAGPTVPLSALEPLADKGLAHHHVRLVGTGLLARIPKQSQLRLGAQDNLLYQAACFERAWPSGHTPRLHRVLSPSAALPRGALLVEEITGRHARLPDDLEAIIHALAAIHALPLPDAARRAPLLDAVDPLQTLQDDVMRQARHLGAAGLAHTARQGIEAELSRLRALCSSAKAGVSSAASVAGPRPPRQLIAFDGHPGNFIIRADGTAVLVDLEKCRYSYPGLDLAHATLYTSTTWDIDAQATLSLPEVVRAYAHWAAAVGPTAAGVARAWHVPLRRAMWLWSISWCAQWRVLSSAPPQTGTRGEDWSAQRSDARLVAHVRDRVDHYLSPAVVVQLRDEFDALDRLLDEQLGLAPVGQ